jgi:hypothetical protein
MRECLAAERFAIHQSGMIVPRNVDFNINTNFSRVRAETHCEWESHGKSEVVIMEIVVISIAMLLSAN